MKKIFFSIFAVLFFVVFQNAFCEEKFSSIDLDGNAVTQKIFSSADVTLVNVWGTFCPPCIREMKELSKLAESLPKNAQVVGIVCDVESASDKDTIENAKSILKKNGEKFKNIIIDKSMSDFLGDVQFVPTTFLVDKNANIVSQKIIGADVPKYKKVLEEYLEKIK